MKIKSYWIYPISLLSFVFLIILLSYFKQYVPFYSIMIEYIYILPLAGAFVYLVYLVKWMFHDMRKRRLDIEPTDD